MAWRGIGILGYVVVFPVTCVGLSRAIAPPTKGTEYDAVSRPLDAKADRS
jgi:hypothetical protein